MRRKILLTNRYLGTSYEIIKSTTPEGFQLLMLEDATQDELEKKVAQADYLLASGRLKISEDVLCRADKLKMIQRTGVGLDSLDLESIKRRKIPLYVNQGVNAESVAEHALLLILSSLRKLSVIDGNTKNGIWKKQEQGTQTHELKGKTVGLIGMGNIARRSVELLKPFGVKILYSDLYQASEEFEKDNNMFFVEQEELLKNSDIISVHCALTDETRALINSESIGKMKDGVILINTARGPIVNALDLAKALRDGKISFAGIDVHEKEPFDSAYPLLGLNNVILTPHIGGITYEAFYKMMHDAMRNIECFEKKELDQIAQYRYL